jgi:hypothetical protein
MLRDVPKRSNEFQRLIKKIYDQLAPAGAKVTESAELSERGAKKKREVDVLVEGEFAGTAIKMAIECRDRSRKNDVEWIDGLIGKYRDIDVQRVIAVSKTGFSETAAEKAKNNRIETRSLKEAMETDWPAELMKLGLGRINLQYRIARYTARTNPGWQSDSPPAFIEDAAGARTKFDDFLKQLTPSIGAVVSKKAFGRFRTVADLTATFMEDVTATPSAARLVSEEGISYDLVQVTFHCEVNVTFDPAPMKRQLYGDVGVTSGLIELPEDKKTFRISVVEVPGKPLSEPLIEEVKPHRSKRAPTAKSTKTAKRSRKTRRT